MTFPEEPVRWGPEEEDAFVLNSIVRTGHAWNQPDRHLNRDSTIYRVTLAF